MMSLELVNHPLEWQPCAAMYVCECTHADSKESDVGFPNRLIVVPSRAVFFHLNTLANGHVRLFLQKKKACTTCYAPHHFLPIFNTENKTSKAAM